MKAQQDKVIVRVINRVSPIHGDDRGTYLQVAIPNQAGHRPFSSAPAPSFEKPYKLYADSLVASEEDLVRILNWLSRRHQIEVVARL
jgi:hypothetical protein